MRFNEQGHALGTPLEVERWLLQSRRLLINGMLIPAIPSIFSERREYDRFVEWLSDQLKVHPRNFVIRGSTLLGFSLEPTPEKVWRACTPESDIDLAIIDPDYYHVIDREVRYFETRPLGDVETAGETAAKRKNRRHGRKFYCYKYFDLPDLPAVQFQNNVLRTMPDYLIDRPRTIEAFVFRDGGVCLTAGMAS